MVEESKKPSWLDRFIGLFGFLDTAGKLLWPTLGGVIMLTLAYLTEALKAYAPFSYGIAFLLGTLSVVFLLAVSGFGYERLKRAQYYLQRQKPNTDPNPLDDTFYRQRINLQTFADPVSKTTRGKTFVDCEFVGPAALMLSGCTFDQNPQFIGVDIVVVPMNHRRAPAMNTVMMIDCTIKRATFINCIIMMSTGSTLDLLRYYPNLPLLSFPPLEK